ncbi:ATP-binding protein [Streptomyces carpaticus]|uniref:AAA family ATPase n=1 Tax=Streptomyces carpaticus TaxID=285558 RepID=UPI002204F764|nr:ATP-binding protein [Streptomyces carpaticus]
MMLSFTPATREQAKARIGLQGPAGSGKTKTALRLAEGLAQGGPIGLIDTERRSALKYAQLPGRPDLGGHEFGHMPMDKHDPRHLVEAVRIAEQAGISVLIVDSWSHFWNGRGGLLEIVEEAGSAPGAGGTFGGWRTGNPIEQQMLDALLNFRGHLIVTMRTKGDYVIDGKKVKKVGVKAVQREGAEYELDVVMDMVEGTATVTKTRYEPLNGMTLHHPGEDIAETILDQLGQGVDPVAAIIDAVMDDALTYPAALELHAKAKGRGLLDASVLHPVTATGTTLGELIAERGRALKPAPAPAPPAAAVQAPPQQQPRPRPAAVPDPPQQAQQTPPAAPSGQVTPPQMRMMHAIFGDLGVTDRAERLRATALIVGHPVESANTLTAADAGTLLDVLSEYAARDDARAAFAAMVDQLAAREQAAA